MNENPNTNSDADVVTSKEAAAILGVIQNSALRILNDENTCFEKKGRRRLYKREDIEALARDRQKPKDNNTEPEVKETEIPTSDKEQPDSLELTTQKQITSTPLGSIAPSTLNQSLPAVQPERIALSSIILEPEIQSRAEIREDVVEEYALEMKEGKNAFPPVELFQEPSTKQYYIGDGNHRVLAAKKRKYQNIFANVHQGGRKAALLFALGANASHGMRRTADDKVRALRLALVAQPESSNREIACLCKVSEGFVRQHRTRCVGNAPDKVKGKDGKLYPAKKTGPAAPNHDPWLRITFKKIKKMPLDPLQKLKMQIDERVERLLKPD